MEHINFLETKKISFNYQIMIIIGVSLILVAIIFSAIQKVRISATENKIKTLEQVVSNLKKTSDLNQKTDDKKDTLSFKGAIDLFKNKISWSNILHLISKNVPFGIWFETINGEVNFIEINGYYLNQSSFNDFSNRLKKIAFFKKVNIVSTKEENIENKKKNNFKTRCEM